MPNAFLCHSPVRRVALSAENRHTDKPAGYIDRGDGICHGYGFPLDGDGSGLGVDVYCLAENNGNGFSGNGAGMRVCIDEIRRFHFAHNDSEDVDPVILS